MAKTGFKEELVKVEDKLGTIIKENKKMVDSSVTAIINRLSKLEKGFDKIQELEERSSKQEAEISALKEELVEAKLHAKSQAAEISALKKELEATSKSKLEDGKFQPSFIEELNTIKEQMRIIREEEEQHKEKTSSWVEVITKTQKKMDEAEKWIEVAKKGKGKESPPIPTPTIINMTLEEEQRRKTRALHVRVSGLKDRDDAEGETKELFSMMGIEATHTKAWRVGKKREGSGESSKERALIIRFPSMEAKKDFLKRRPTLKKTGIFLGDDLTLSQLAHMKEVMPEIRAAREKGKVAFYRDGRVVIMERRSS